MTINHQSIKLKTNLQETFKDAKIPLNFKLRGIKSLPNLKCN